MKHLYERWQSNLLLCLVLTGTAVGQAAKATTPPIGFNGQVAPGTTVTIIGTTQGQVSIYPAQPDAAACNTPFLQVLPQELDLKSVGTSATTKQFSFDPAKTKTLAVTLANPLKADDKVCLIDIPATGKPAYSSLATVTGAAPPPPPGIGFVDTLWTGADTVWVTGKTGDTISIFAFPSGAAPKPASGEASNTTVCSYADVGPIKPLALGKSSASAAASPTTFKLTADGDQKIQLQDALVSGDELCIVDEPKSGGDDQFSYLSTVQNAAASSAPDFTGTPASGDTSIVIKGTSGQSVSVYQLDSPATGNCATTLGKYKGKLLPLAANGSNATASNSTTLSGTPPYTVTLQSPLLAGTQLCLEQSTQPAAKPAASASDAAQTPPAGQSTDKTGGSVAAGTATTDLYSPQPITVSDSNNPYPFVRTFYTVGAMIDNQNGTSGSSTGAEYLDIGMAFALPPESYNGWRPGINTSISGRFSAIPVAASSTTTATSSSSGTLNILSTQESARVLGTASFPFRTDRTSDGGYGFFTAPLIKAGFDTLLNPAASATTGSSGSATVSTASFAPVYWEYSSGMRLGYRQYSKKSDATPRTVTQVDITIGKYSNLQSFVCEPNIITGTSSTEPANTSCTATTAPTGYTGPTAPTGSYYLEQQSRTNLYRMEVEGFFKFPGTPFVLGLDANLPQSALAPRNLDVLNKAGGNVSIYFGVSGNLVQFFKNLKLSGSSQ